MLRLVALLAVAAGSLVAVATATSSPLKTVDESEILQERVRRQVQDQHIKDVLCKDKNQQEYFRLTAGETHCRDVVACGEQGLLALRCPQGLAFDIHKQTCEWKDLVKSCNIKSRPKKILPLLNTPEPICEEGYLACGSGDCILQSLFCDEKADCGDGSDENSCGPKTDPNRAPQCDKEVCKLPDCYCSPSSTEIPGDLPAKSVPQMVVISFDDAVNHNNFDIFKRIFNGERQNPNGCDIKATFFVSHKYTNYSMVQDLYRQGHELAAHSITHTNVDDYWTNGPEEIWTSEMKGSKTILEKFANLPQGAVLGARAPLLRVGGNRQFQSMSTSGFLYDSSLVAALQNPPLWPYTMFYTMPHKCHGNFQKCPTRSYGIWEMVMNELDRREIPAPIVEREPGCAMLDSCSTIRSGDNLYNVLTHNFIRHYDQNRAPLGIYLHAAWFKKDPEMLDAFNFWIDETLRTYNDVYFVTMSQVLQWMQQPVISQDAVRLPAWRDRCISSEGEQTCSVVYNCNLASPEQGGLQLRMQTCSRCPQSYPWLDDPEGEGRVRR